MGRLRRSMLVQGVTHRDCLGRSARPAQERASQASFPVMRGNDGMESSQVSIPIVSPHGKRGGALALSLLCWGLSNELLSHNQLSVPSVPPW